ncbi:MAG: MFS transporter [Candidatus Latescibacterota bacterium]
MKNLPSIILKLGLLSLLNDISSEMVFPLLPLLLVTLPGGGPVAIGIIEGIAETTGTFLKLGSGVWADRIRRRTPFIAAGYSLAGMSRPLIALATVWPAVLALRFLDRVGKGLRGAPRDAMIADSVHPSRRGAAFGFQRMMDHAGAVAGPLIALLLLGSFGLSVRQVILLSGVPAVVLIGVLITLREPEHHLERQESVPKAEMKILNRDFRLLLVAVFIFTLGNSTDAFLILRLSEAGISAASIALLWSLHHLVKIAGAWLGGRATDRLGSKSAMLAGLALYAMVYLAFGSLAAPFPLVGVFIMYGASIGVIEPAEGAWVAGLSTRSKRGAAYGLYSAAKGFAALPASIGFGLVWRTFGVFYAFLAGAILAIAAAAILFFVQTETGMPPEVRETDGAVVDR